MLCRLNAKAGRELHSHNVSRSRTLVSFSHGIPVHTAIIGIRSPLMLKEALSPRIKFSFSSLLHNFTFSQNYFFDQLFEPNSISTECDVPVKRKPFLL